MLLLFPPTVDNDLKPTLPGNGTLVPLEKKAPNVIVRRFTRRYDIPQNEITTAWLPIATARPRATGLQSCPARIKTVVQASNVQKNSKHPI